MRIETMLDYTGSFYKHWDDKKVRELIKEWDLDPWTKISNISEGERQKLSIIQAMGHNPDVFIFDEPVASLDPVARRKFIKQLVEMNLSENKTMLFSTHITSDLERIAADIAVLHNGSIQYKGDLANLKEKYVKLHIHSEVQLPETMPFGDVVSAQIQSHTATLTVRDITAGEIAEFEKKYKAIINMEHLNLEDIFLEMNQ
jgi:ABC-2 type transport system ATP-binding protein